jgi:ABC-type glycerol-3-phosphate transport system permease component
LMHKDASLIFILILIVPCLTIHANSAPCKPCIVTVSHYAAFTMTRKEPRKILSILPLLLLLLLLPLSVLLLPLALCVSVGLSCCFCYRYCCHSILFCCYWWCHHFHATIVSYIPTNLSLDAEAS